jgi:hypothetical protein
MKNTIENRFNCPKRLWNKFSDDGKVAYNNVRGVNLNLIISNHEALMGPKAWDAVSHNYACFAAWQFSPSFVISKSHIKSKETQKPEYISSTQASATLSVSKRTLFNWRNQGILTEYCVPGTRKIFYRYDELIALFEKMGNEDRGQYRPTKRH